MLKSQINTALGFDFGMKKIGIASGQMITKSATPLLNIKAIDGQPNWKELINLINEWRPDALIVGMPLNMDGSNQQITDKTRIFVSTLKTKTSIPVFTTDERLTTKASKDIIFTNKGYRGLKKTPIDSVAAAMILEQWLSQQV